MKKVYSCVVWICLVLAFCGTDSVLAFEVDNKEHEEIHGSATNMVMHDMSWAVEKVNSEGGGSISFNLPGGYTYTGSIYLHEKVAIRGDAGIVFNCIFNCDKNLEAYDVYGSASFNCDDTATINRGEFKHLSVENAASVKNVKMVGAGVGAFSTITNCEISGLEVPTGCTLEGVRMGTLMASNGVTMRGCVFTNDRSWARIYSPAELDMRFCGEATPGIDPGREIYLYDCAEDFTIQNQDWTNVNVTVYSGDVIFRSNVLFDVLGQFVDGIEFHDCDVMGRTRLYGGKDHQMKGCNVSGQALFYNCTNVVVGRDSLGNYFAADERNDDGWLVMTNCTGGAVEGNQFGKNKDGKAASCLGMWLNGCQGVAVTENGWHTNRSLDVTYNNSFFVEACSNITVQGNTVSNCPGMSFYNSQHSLIGGEGQSGACNYLTDCNNGIMLWGGSHDITIQYNYIGLTRNRTRAGNNRGISVYNAYDIQIGGSNADHFVRASQDAVQNVISGNKYAGVYIKYGTNIMVQGNLIGTEPAGEYAMGNEGHGVVLAEGASDCWIGGDQTALGNVISGNESNGIFIANYACSNRIRNNAIGTDITGTSSMPNEMNGIAFASRASHSVSNIIGGYYQRGDSGADEGCKFTGFNHFQGNVISGNRTNGLVLGGVGTGVFGNYIGADKTGKKEKDNSEYGIYCLDSAEQCQIGKEAVDDPQTFASNEYRNIISGNGTSGILLQGEDNRLYDNFIGIDFDGKELHNFEHGVEIGFGFNNYVQHNRIAHNYKYGIFVNSSAGSQSFVGGSITNGDANYIYNNDHSGMVISNGAVAVYGNYFGLDPDTQNLAPNRTYMDIYVMDLSETDAVNIGGDSDDTRNVIFCYDSWDQSAIRVENSVSFNCRIDRNDCNYDSEYPWMQSTSRFCVAIYNSANVALGLNGYCNMALSTNAGLYASSSTNIVVLNTVAGTTNTEHFSQNDIQNFGHGMLFENCQNVTVGDPSMGNTIAANCGDGIRIENSTFSTNRSFGNIMGNSIGCGALTNGGDGISLHKVYGAIIGGGASGEYDSANTIGGSGGSGVLGDTVQALSFRGNRIGVDASGAAYANRGNGINLCNAQGCEVGSAQSNVFQGVNYLSGNAGCGLALTNSSATTFAGAMIGLNQSGTAVPNGNHGVALYQCRTNVFTETADGSPCVISGNDQDGIYIEGNESASNVIAQALIGLNASGSAVAGNRGCGVRIHSAAGNSVGSANEPGGVVIGGNMLGVRISGVHVGANTIQNCLIGVTTNAAVGNLNNGIVIETSGQIVGGEESNQGNYIGANGDNGIFIAHSSNVLVRNNTIGFGPDAVLLRGNWSAGILMTNSGGCTVMTNLIANNTNGIVAQTGIENAFFGNSIYSNMSYGIRLEQNANGGIVPPTVLDAWTSKSATTVTQVRVSFDGAASTPVTLQFFSNHSTNAAGRFEGANLLDTRAAQTDAAGTFKETFTLASVVETGRWITVTATIETNGTSEFSNGRQVANGASGSGAVQTVIEPADVNAAGAMWRLTSGGDTNWHASTDTVSGLPEGSYAVDFLTVAGWHTPQEQQVAVSNDAVAHVTGIYTQMTGAALCVLQPTAVQSTGRWQIVDFSGTVWYTNAQLVAGIPVGAYTAQFQAVSGAVAPAEQAFSVVSGNTNSLIGTYTIPNPQLAVTNQGGSVDYAVSNVTLGGTANSAVTAMSWTNVDSTAFGSITVATNWSTAIPLAIGTNRIHVQAANLTGATVTDTVTFVRADQNPVLSVNPTNCMIVIPFGSTAQRTSIFAVKNTGGKTLTYEIQCTTNSWFAGCTPTTGSLVRDASQTHTVTFNASAFDAMGTYTTVVNVAQTSVEMNEQTVTYRVKVRRVGLAGISLLLFAE